MYVFLKNIAWGIRNLITFVQNYLITIETDKLFVLFYLFFHCNQCKGYTIVYPVARLIIHTPLTICEVSKTFSNFYGFLITLNLLHFLKESNTFKNLFQGKTGTHGIPGQDGLIGIKVSYM